MTMRCGATTVFGLRNNLCAKCIVNKFLVADNVSDKHVANGSDMNLIRFVFLSRLSQ